MKNICKNGVDWMKINSHLGHSQQLACILARVLYPWAVVVKSAYKKSIFGVFLASEYVKNALY